MKGKIPYVRCESCKIVMVWHFGTDPELTDPEFLVCKTEGCPNKDKRYKVPTIELEELEGS